MIQQRLLSLLAALGAVFFLGIGLWAFSDASSFFDELADFPPYNAHFIHDVGAFHGGLGAVLPLGGHASRVRVIRTPGFLALVR